MNTKHVAQIGLDHKAEYRFLANPIIGGIYQEPQLLHLPFRNTRRNTNWIYHGVDCRGAFPENHKEVDNEHYYTVAITDTNGTEVTRWMGEEERETECKTLETFFKDAGISECELLVLDIEGWETRVLQAYTGQIPVNFAIIEHHEAIKEYTEPNNVNLTDFIDLIKSKGFLINNILSEGTGSRTKLFLQKDRK